ncbi:hypothetical protein BRARA_G02376 [Brassica rapa]|uniref:Uncharacterized protein n=1 Tax=Brassica campestris TaxID=3711 RepID=A0A397YW70_BRACM|nr:hypothetical protein BRARA_G02376 [Brassica rapa]
MATTVETPLLEEHVMDAVDHDGLVADRSNTGRWTAAWFIIGVEVAERFAYYGIASNLISYLTGPLGQSTAVAAANVNAWSGISSLLPVLGAFVADAFLGRENKEVVSASPSSLLNVLFFFSLYLVAVGQSGHKPCVQAFGADQFDEKDTQEKRERSSFFNWWYLSLSAGICLAIVVVVYIQEAVGWALGFGIPWRRSYRYSKSRQEKETNPFTRIGRVFFRAFKNRRLSQVQTELEANPSQGSPEKLRCLSKALLAPHASTEEDNVCSVSDVEDATALVRLIPVWVTTLGYALPYAQYMTFFTKQGPYRHSNSPLCPHL